MLLQTKRSYTNVETGELYDLWHDSNTDVYKLISPGSNNLAKGTEANGWYLSTSFDVIIKIDRTKEIELKIGQFYNLKEGEKVTHKKYLGFKRFSKA